MDKICKSKVADARTKGHGTPDSEAIARRLQTFEYKPTHKASVLAKYESLRKRCQ